MSLLAETVKSINGVLPDDNVNVLVIGGEGGILSFQTSLDLRTAYPNGINQPVWIIAENSWYHWTKETQIYTSYMTKKTAVLLASATTFWKGNLFKVKQNIELKEIAVNADGSPALWNLWEYDGTVLSKKITDGSFVASIKDNEGYLKQELTSGVVLDITKSLYINCQI